MAQRRALVDVLLFVVVLGAAVPSQALADDLRAHATVGAAHALGQPQGHEFGWGGAGSLSLEVPLADTIGIEGKIGGLVLSEGSPPKNPSFVQQSTGLAALGTLGLRIRPFFRAAGPWLSAGLGVVQTGDLTRLGFDGALGWDFRLTRKARWDVGPYAGYIHVFQADDSLRPNDAHVLTFGLHIGLGVPDRRIVRGDLDRDGVFDDEDACPAVPGVRTDDPSTNGCPPPDRDQDGVSDGEDACPDVAGVRTNDPKTNGCPEDRDEDGISDVEDACPDKPGVRSSDPKANGCPRQDRDKDGVYDDEDACPDVPGVRTIDTKTNGCPPASDSVHVEKDRILLDDVILFDLDSPRVHRASWGIIKKLADFIVATPDILEVSIEGHADATGRPEHNMALSRARAESVKKLLVQYGVPPERVQAEAFGRSRLKVQTNRAEAANRRVEFWITRTRQAVTP